MTDKAHLPWTWTITADDPSTCPSSSAILGTFATVNILVSLLGAITGHRLVVKFCSCGFFGKQVDNWWYLWLIPLGLQLSANAVVAALMQNVPGYKTTYSIGELVLFYTVRPRISWIVLFVLCGWRPKAAPATRREDNPSHWRSSAMSNFFSETVLEAISLVYIGRTVHFAASRGYYIVGSEGNKSLSTGAKMMYGAAIPTLVLTLIYLCIIWGCGVGVEFTHRFKRRRTKPMTGLAYLDFDDWGFIFIMLYCAMFQWACSWVFWAGYLKVSGPSYCPPKLLEQGVVWIVFSIAGIFFGTGA